MKWEPWFQIIQNSTEVAHSSVTVPASEFLIGHGRSCFLKAEKAAKILREAQGLRLCLKGEGLRLKGLRFRAFRI